MATSSLGPCSTIRSVRRIGAFNTLGTWTFYCKEVQRFIGVPVQTLLAPVISIALFITIFTLAIGQRSTTIEGVAFYDFLVVGLLAMTVLQNGFANSSSSILHAKVLGNIVDVLMPPLTAMELTLAYLLGALTRALMVGTIVFIIFIPFTQNCLCRWSILAFYAISAGLLMAALGLIGGIWARKFDHMATITNFIITPLTFLSGTFYSVQSLPQPWRSLVAFNPFYYIIDGFRFALIGYHDSNLATGVVVITVVTIGLTATAWIMIDRGYRLKG